MPGFRHPRNPARSPRGPAHIGESPRRSRPPGPRSNRGAIRPLPRRAAPAPPARRRRARACRGRRVGAFRRCGAGRSRCSAGPDLRRHRWPRDAAAPAWRIARGRRCRGGAGDAAMRRSGRGGRRESPRFERGGRRELPQRRQRRERSSQRSAQHHPPEGRARPARRPATPSPLPQADVRGSAPPRARARRAADPEDFGLFSLGRAAAQAPPVRLPAQRPRRPLAPATRSPLPQADVRGSAPPRARACRVFDPEEFGLFSLGRAAAQAPPCDCLPKGRAARSPPHRPCRRRMSGDPLPPRARARRAADPEEFELFSLGRAATQPPPCDCLLKGHCLPRGRACPKAAPPARPCRRRMSRDPLPPRARGAASRRRPGGVRAIQPRARRGAAAARAIACPKAAPAQRPLPAQGPRLPKGRPCRRRMSGDPLPRRRGRAASPTQRSSSLSASGAPRRRRRPCDCLLKGRARPGAAPAQGPRPPKGRACPRAAPAAGPCPPKGRACPKAAPAAGGSPGIRSPRRRGRAAYSTRRRSSLSASGAPRRRRRHAIACPRAAPAQRPLPAAGGSPGIRSPRRRGRAAYSTRRRSSLSASGAPRRRRRPCDCLPKGRACPRAACRACPKAAPAKGPPPAQRAAPAKVPRPPKGRARQRAAPAQGPKVPAQRPIGPQTPGGAAGAPRHSAPCRAKRA